MLIFHVCSSCVGIGERTAYGKNSGYKKTLSKTILGCFYRLYISVDELYTIILVSIGLPRVK